MTLSEPLSQRELLGDTDISELDFDDEPTAVDTRQARLKRDSIFPPADPQSQREVFSLIERNTRPSLMLVDESPIDFASVLHDPADLPGWENLPATERAPRPPEPRVSSIAPVALPADDERPEVPPRETQPARTAYGVTMGVLASVAAAIVFWFPAGTAEPAAVAQPPAAAVAEAVAAPITAAPIPRVIDLDEVRVVASEGAPLAAGPSIPPTATSLVVPAAALDSPITTTPEPLLVAHVETPDVPTDSLPVVAPPAPTAPPFDPAAAGSALTAAAAQAAACREQGAPSAATRVSVTFAPSGRVATVNVGGAYAGTNSGGCIAKTFRNVRVEPFDGAPVTVHKNFRF